ncbi:transglycosylase SLT domain-containing protein [Nonomuraea sp. NPDC050536]|uniref:lytic transglycosylase domain-containing protein n=1 Tax=Nonomuraea sp. NPDC050536 TaxID=3364366 RepID=UPI0037C58FF6
MRFPDVVVAGGLVVVLAGCGVAEGAQRADGEQASTVAAGNGSRVAGGNSSKDAAGAVAPAPDVEIPSDAGALAGALKQTSTALYAGIDAWTAGSAAAAPQDVVLYALHQQRIYRAMARDPKLARETISRLPKPLAAEARNDVKAVSGLLSLARPISAAQRKNMRLAEAEPAKRLRGYFQAGEKRFGVEWEVLAAIMLVETKFGRVTSASSSGAQGPMQFMPGTWKQYGMGGNVHRAKDAVLGAANYLKASGAPGNYRRAVWAYNHDNRYVDAVLAHARQIKRDPRSFYAYYNWQVFVLSKTGDIRLTGPR